MVLTGFLTVALAVLSGSGGDECSTASQGNAASKSGGLAKAAWHLGDRWIVETQGSLDQVGTAGPRPRYDALRWEFRVTAEEPIRGQLCWRVSVRCITPNVRAGEIVLWCSRDSGNLLKLRAELPTVDGTRTLEEEYRPDAQGPVAVITPIRAIPCDIPAFLGAEVKEEKSFGYAVQDSSALAKDNGALDFVYEVSQTISVPSVQVKSLVHEGFSKSLDLDRLTQITLQAGTHRVRQHWQLGVPWPVLSENGTTVSRLVAVFRTNEKEQDQNSSDTRAKSNQASVSSSASDARVPSRAKDASAEEVEIAQASFLPWSGSWWPHREGGLTGPLLKYDRETGDHAATWETDHHAGVAAPDWHGHCHAWAAAAVLDREPREPRILDVSFGIGDQKGLITACHGLDIANVYGDRFGDGEGSEDRSDLAPDELWRLLRAYVANQRLPLILDLEAGPPVWNYPVYRYQILSQPATSDRVNCELKLWVADDGLANRQRPDRSDVQDHHGAIETLRHALGRR